MTDSTELEKLPTLIHHWIDHNGEHEVKLREWAAKVEELGRKDVGQIILQAAIRMSEANNSLKNALETLAER